MRRECVRKPNPAIAEDHNRFAVDPRRLILGHFAPLAPRFRRLSYISDTPPLNLALAPGMRSETESGDRKDFSRFHEDPNRSAVDPGRLILGPFAPLAPRFRRLSYISDTPPLNLALASGMRSETEPGDRQDFSRFHEDPNRLAVDPGRLIRGPFAPIAPRFCRLSHISDTPLLISPLHRECVPKPNPAIGRICRDFTKILTDWPSIRVA